MGDVVSFPGAGNPPAPAPLPAPPDYIPPAPALPADLDAIDDRYTELLEAREKGDGRAVRLLSAACADDVPVLRAEIARVQRLRRELAAELDRISGMGGQ